MRTQIPGKQILDRDINTEDIADDAVTDVELSPTGVAAGSYTKLTVTSKGRATHGENPTTLAGYGITDAQSKNAGVVTVGQEADMPNSRRLAGDANEITITNANGDVSVGIADNAVVPGTGSLTIPHGTTTQRPTGAEGQIRKNTQTNDLEVFAEGAWQAVVVSKDLRLKMKNTLYVQKEPGPGQFGSINAALASITDNSVENRYVIRVAGGSYYEDPIQMKRYVSVVGDNAVSVLIFANNPDADLITGINDSALESVTLSGATATNRSAVRFSNAVQNESFRSFVCNDVRFGANYRYLTVTSTGNSTTVFLFNAQFGGSMPYYEGIYVESSGGGQARALIRASTTRGAVAPLPNRFAYVSGPGAELFLNGCQLRCSITSPNSTGIHGRNGAMVRILSSSLRGFDIAIWIEHAGATPWLYGYSAAMESNNTDLKIEHPQTSGAFIGVAEKSKTTCADGAPLSLFFLDPVVQGSNIVGALNMGDSVSELTNVTDLLLRTPPMGIYSGGILTKGTGTNVNVSPGVGYVRVNAETDVKRIEFQGGTRTIPPGTIKYLYIDSAGELQMGDAEPQTLSTLTIGRALAGASSILSIGDIAVRIDGFGNHLDEFLRRTVGPVYVSGSIVTENATTPRGLDVTAGYWYYSTVAKHPEGRTGISWISGYKNAGNTVLVPRTTVDNTTYSNGSGLQPLTAGYFAKHVLYSTGEGADTSFAMVHATEQHPTIEEAIKAPLPTPPFSSDASPKIASIIVQQGNDSIVQIIDERPRFFTTSGSGSTGTSDHGDLLGLLDDDHPQYLKADGTRPLTDDLDLGSNNLLNVGSINGMNFLSHGSRHNPNNEDPISTASAVGLNTASTNTEGLANSLARSDHTHQITGFQPTSIGLTNLLAIAGTGHIVRTAANTYAVRTMTGDSDIVITNGSGVAGNPTFSLGDVGTASTYLGVTTDAKGRVISGTTTAPWSAITGRPTTLAGYGITDAQPLDSDLTALANSGGTGFYVRTGDGTSVTRTFAMPAAGLTLTNPDGVANAPTFALANDLAAVEGLGTTGITVRTAADTWATRSIVAPPRGITVTNPAGLAGDITLGLANNLAGLESMTTGGIMIRLSSGGTSAYTTRNVVSSTLTITHPGGIADNITLDLSTAGITAGTYRQVTTDQYGRVTSGTNPTTLAGYGITNGQPLDADLTAISAITTTGISVRSAADTWVTRSLVAGTGISITNPAGLAGDITIAATNNGTVTSVGLTVPSILTVTGSPITSAGTFAVGLATQAANTVLAGPSSGAAAVPTFRKLDITELGTVSITSPVANNLLTYNGTNWVNTAAQAASAAGNIGVSPQGGGTSWTLISGSRYYADFVHNLGTNNVVVTVYNVATNAVVIPDEVVITNGNSIRVTVIGNSRTLRVVVVANGVSIAAGGSTPSAVAVSHNGVTVNAASTRLNFVGATTVADQGGGVTNIAIGARFTNYANSFDTPNNSDWAVNAFAPVMVDPVNNALNIRSFSNTVEQGVGFMCTIPTGATIVNFRIRGRSSAAQSGATVVQWRVYFRMITNNGPIGAWVGPLDLTNMNIPASANFQSYLQNSNLALAGLQAGQVYQFELTRKVSGITGTNLPVPFYLAETTFEFA